MGFLNPLFLIGAAAAAVPVLVHLVRRTQAKRLQFPSLMFLRRIEQKTVRRRQLRNLLLLAVRCAALLLLALAFSRPYVTSGNEVAPDSPEPASVILLDGSYSMQYPGVFDRAKDAARRVVEGAGATEKLALILFSSTSDILRPLRLGTSEVRALIDETKAGPGTTNYLQAIQTADALLREARAKPRKIYLISDFQASGWNRTDSSFKLSRDIELVPVDVSENEALNCTVMDVRSEPVVYAQKYTGKLVASLACFSDNTADDESARQNPIDGVAELKINDLPIERRQVKLSPSTPTIVEFSGFNVPEGSNRAAIELSGDRFPLDNRSNFTIRRENQIKVLVIETASRGRSDSFYVKQSLLAGETNPYELTIKTAGAVDPGELTSYRSVILNDASGISQSLAAALKSFVERGGGLVIATGRHAEASEFNSRFKEISPAQLGEQVVTRSGYALLSQVRSDHPIFSPFSRSGRLTATRVYGYHRSTPTDQASVIAALDDGTPLLMDRLLGSGKVILVTTSLDTSWNDLPLSPVFVPLLNQMLEYIGERRQDPNHLIGQTFVIRPDKDGQLPAIDAPDEHRITDLRANQSGEAAVSADQSGFYRIRYSGGVEYVAVNLDPKEGDLSRASMDEFLASIAASREDATTVAAPTGPLTVQEIEQRQRLWLLILAVALMLFVLEALLARRIRVPKLIG